MGYDAEHLKRAEAARWDNLTGTGEAADPSGAAVTFAARNAVRPVSRGVAARMTHAQYKAAEAERSRLGAEGLNRELAPDELTRFKQATAAVLGYLDFVFGPEPVAPEPAGRAQPPRKTVRPAR